MIDMPFRVRAAVDVIMRMMMLMVMKKMSFHDVMRLKM